MSTTLSLQKTVNWARPFLKGQPIDVSQQEPALTNGNMVLQTMMAAPFKWRHNRAPFSFSTQPNNTTTGTAAACDYTLALPDFGYLEDQFIQAGTGISQKVYELQSKFSLARPTGSPARPTHIAAQIEDGAGNITFRTNMMPDQVYLIAGEYQKKAPYLSSLGSRITVPDEFAFVFNWGFLTISSMLVNDARFAVWEKYFISRLLGLQDGLDEVDINIFLGLWQSNTKTALRTQGMAQQGQAGRGV